MKKLGLTIMAMVMAVTIFSTTAPKPAEAACVVGVKSWDVLWIRSGPGIRYRKVGAIPYNACRVRVYWRTCRGFWCRVYYRGVRGWSHTRYLRPLY